jgi:hypothetical protein
LQVEHVVRVLRLSQIYQCCCGPGRRITVAQAFAVLWAARWRMLKL